MRTKQLFLTLALLCAVVQGAWAQASWDEVYAMTNTTSANWTKLNAGSSTGKTLGTAGATTYYYADANLSFTNSTAGGSGLTIRGTVYLYVPEGVTITCTGANANGATGAGAGIELASGNTLYLLGGGTVNATGGNAANGGDGCTGRNAYSDYDYYICVGGGGAGGNGGGGAGAGIGTRGGNGGNGGAWGSDDMLYDNRYQNGKDGAAGSAGSTAGGMGTLYVVTSFFHLSATGGNAGTSGGSGGQRGRGCIWDTGTNWCAAGGGGGGGGGFGGAASNIGTGGPGGGGGGAGATGASDGKSSGCYDVTAYGGKGGKNADGSDAGTGADAPTTGEAYFAGWVDSDEEWDSDDFNPASGNVSMGNGGSGGSKGGNSAVGTTNYMVSSDVTIPSRINVCGNMVLNLGEGATLHAPKGIEVSIGNNLTINGPGTLTIDGCDAYKSGIGAERVGTLTINGGTINAAGGEGAAGIGGDYHNTSGGQITINGGVVNARGGTFAAGIGGGMGRTNGNEPQYWGVCGAITIIGGQVTAIGGQDGAGIGPGNNFYTPNSGSLTLGWTNLEDFVHSSGYMAYPDAPFRISISHIYFIEGKQFMFDGTATIATEANLKSSGETIIVPYAAGQQTLSGSGTEGDPYLISSTADWNKFVHNVLDGNNYNSQYVKLMADIDITKCVGVHNDNTENARPFSGTFLGNNHTITATLTDNSNQGTAPFRYISGATIKNLKVAGTIASNKYHTSGLVGFADGTNLIEACTVSATIDISSDYAGGIIGHGKTSNTTIKDCIFSGLFIGRDVYSHTIIGANYQEIPVYRNPNNIAGFWGWSTEGTPALQNCLDKGTYTDIGTMHPISLQGGSGTITDCYYLTPQIGSPTNVCTVSGTYRAYTVNTVEGEIMRSLVLVDGNTYYTPCIISNIDESYHRTGSSVSVTPAVTASDGTTQLTLGTDFTATLNGDDVAAFPINISTLGIKTLTITGQGNCNGTKSVSFVVYGFNGEGTAENPYIISNTDEWDAFVFVVNSGNACSGKYVKLMDDIAVTNKCGTVSGSTQLNPFSGTFLGNNKTITVTFTDDGSQGIAPFRYINGATIKDLTVTGTITSNQYHSAGLVGFASGTNTIEDCLVTATLNISSDYAGGIIGHGLTSATTIRGCAFTGTVNGVDGNRSNIGGIWGWSNSGTPALVNCLEAGTYTNIASMHPMGLQGGSGTITNCYYLNPQVGSPKNACTVSGAKQAYTAATAPANLGSLVEDYGMVKTYQNGILVGGTYYVAPATVTLADNADNSTTISDKADYVADVTLQGRTLYKDGKWNTLCLPFNVTIADSPLAGATARPLNSASISGTTLTLTFDDAVTALKAGTPYIIKWASGDNIVNPVFNGVTVSSDMHPYDSGEADGEERVRFLGTYKSTTFTAADNSILLLGGENKLYYPAAGAGIGSCRAYFKIGEDGVQARPLTAFSIDFGDGENNATGIIEADSSFFTLHSSFKGTWYDIQGRRIEGKPTQHGVYINNGRKVVIK